VAFEQGLPGVHQLAGAAIAGAMSLAAWAFIRRPPSRSGQGANTRNAARGAPAPCSLPDQAGLRELRADSDYRRMLETLEATPATSPAIDAEADGGDLPNLAKDHYRADDETGGAQQLSHAFRDAAMGMVILDREWKILSANQKLADATGFSIGELTGKPVVSLAAEGQKEEMILGLRNVSKGGVPSYRSERRLIRKDGSALWMRCCVTRLGGPGETCDATPGEAHILVLSEDITAEVAARENLVWRSAHDALTRLPALSGSQRIQADQRHNGSRGGRFAAATSGRAAAGKY